MEIQCPLILFEFDNLKLHHGVNMEVRTLVPTLVLANNMLCLLECVFCVFLLLWKTMAIEERDVFNIFSGQMWHFCHTVTNGGCSEFLFSPYNSQTTEVVESSLITGGPHIMKVSWEHGAQGLLMLMYFSGMLMDAFIDAHTLKIQNICCGSFLIRTIYKNNHTSGKNDMMVGF